jgi:hypothetical protein
VLIVDSLRKVLMVLALIPVMWMASCAFLGGAAAVAVKSVVTPEVIASAKKQHAAHMLREHNEELNREASYDQRFDYPRYSSRYDD